MIIGIAPDNGQVDEPLVKQNPIVMIGNGVSGMNIAQETRSNVKETFEINTNSDLCNQVAADFKGYFAYGIKNADGSYQPISESQNLELLGVLPNGNTHSKVKTISFRYAFPVGNTTLFGLYSTDNETWKKCDYVNLTPFVVNATETTLTLVGITLSVDVIPQDELLSEQENTLQLAVNNKGDFEYLGLLNVYTNTTNVKPDIPTTQVYSLIPSQGSATPSVTIIPSVGDLYVWVTDAVGVVLLKAKKFIVTQSTEPKLVLVSKESNATSGEYETENAYIYSYRVKAPKANDDKAVFTYRIRNDGGTYQAKFIVQLTAYGSNFLYKKFYEDRRIKSGETVILRIEARPEDYNNSHFIGCLMYLYDESKTLDVSAIPEANLESVDGSGYWPIDKQGQFVYVAGAPTDISSIMASGTSVSGGKGEILISSDKDLAFKIYNLNGQAVANVSVKAGEQVAVPVSSGLYIVNGKKIIVK